MPAHSSCFILSSSNRILNRFVRAIDGLKTNNVYHSDTDSLNIFECWEKTLGCNRICQD